MKKYLTILTTTLLFAVASHADNLQGWSTSDLCDMVNGSAGLSISSKYIKKLKGTTSWTSKEYKAIQRGKVFSGMSEDALLCAFPNLELDLKDIFGSVYIMVTPNHEHIFSTDKNGKLLMAPYSYFGM